MQSNPASLGRAATGQKWAAVKGIWGEDGGTARAVTPDPISPSYALIRSGRGSGSVAFTAADVAEGMGIAFRCENELNCWTLTARVQFGTWQLTKTTGLNVIDMQNVGQVPIADGTRVRVELRPEGFDVFVNDVLARHVDSPPTQTDLNDEGRSGLVLAPGGDPTARYAAFRTVQYDIVGPGAPVHDSFDRAGSRRARRDADRAALAGGERHVDDPAR